VYRLLLVLSVLPIAACLVLCWWFGTRVLRGEGTNRCRCDLDRWEPAPDDDKKVQRAEQTGGDFGAALRERALADWKKREPKPAAARTNHRNFGLAVPPLSAVFAFFAVIVGKVPAFGGIAIVIAATALSCVLGLLSLPAELTVIRRFAQQKSLQGIFPERDDLDTVIRCAMAHAWQASLPPIVKWFQPQK